MEQLSFEFTFKNYESRYYNIKSMILNALVNKVVSPLKILSAVAKSAAQFKKSQIPFNFSSFLENLSNLKNTIISYL